MFFISLNGLFGSCFENICVILKLFLFFKFSFFVFFITKNVNLTCFLFFFLVLCVIKNKKHFFKTINKHVQIYSLCFSYFFNH